MDKNNKDLLVERQDALNQKMRLRGKSVAKRAMNRLDGGDKDSARKLTGMVMAGFEHKINSFIEDQLKGRHSQCKLIKHLIADQKADVVELLVHPHDLGAIIIKCILTSLTNKKKKMGDTDEERVTATRVSFLIGQYTEFALNEQAVDLLALDQDDPEDAVRVLKEQVLEGLGADGKGGEMAPIKDVVNWLGKLVGQQPWGETQEEVDREHLAVGEKLLQMFLRSPLSDKDPAFDGLYFSDLFEIDKVHSVRGGKHSDNRYFQLSKLGSDWLKAHDDELVEVGISFLPMVVAPRNWDEQLLGGHWDDSIQMRYSFISGVSDSVTKSKIQHNRPGFDFAFKTLNALQQTGFQVNHTVLAASKWVLKNKVTLKKKGCPSWGDAWVSVLGQNAGASYNQMREMIEWEDGRPTDATKDLEIEWLRKFIEVPSEKVTRKETIVYTQEEQDKMIRKAWKKTYARPARKVKLGNQSRVLQSRSVVKEAELLKDDVFYFPYRLDFRTRIYPIAGQLSPQGADMSKGMLLFSEEKWLANTDLNAVSALAKHLAGTFGVDKVDFDDREIWVLDNEEDILASADDFRSNQFWMTADKPFEALAACVEWARHVRCDSGFYTNLPIAVDGSNNALQHISAALLDGDVAEKVNLLDADVPQDVYQFIMDKAIALLEIDAQKTSKTGKPTKSSKLAKRMLDLDVKFGGVVFNRKTGKKSVMCLGYAIGKRSSSKYCKAAIMELDIEICDSDLALILANIGPLVWDAMSDGLGCAEAYKVFLQQVALNLVDAGCPVAWKSATGFPCEQRYYQKDPKPQKVKVTVDGVEFVRKYPKMSSVVAEAQTSNAMSPNVTHSQDSAHLQFTVCAAVDAGITSLLVVHDSYAVHATDSSVFDEIIRQEFVQMYQMDQLGRIWFDAKDAVEERGGEWKVPQPVRGDFDITQVLDAKYFFA